VDNRGEPDGGFGCLTGMSEVSIPVPVPVTADRAAGFREFYAAQYANIAGYAFQLTRDADLAHDLAQEAFTRLLTRWARVREPRPYLFLTVTNLVHDTWKAGGRQRRLVGHLRATTGPDVPAPDRTVADAVARLPRRHLDVVLLYYYADLPVPEVAAAVRRPEGTVKRLLAEARALLATSLGDPHA
jgi:RNA polymerase sigma-70 factor (ECF subfamily)